MDFSFVEKLPIDSALKFLFGLNEIINFDKNLIIKKESNRLNGFQN